jgi:hypothetical protein
MGSQRDYKTREIASLQLQLAEASQLLDQLEKRFRQRACQMTLANSTTLMAENAELRFARYVASGMTKLEVQ